MRHFLAYGNSDQESFRRPEVLSSFDVITVPGTIASFYEDATAGFVLTSQKPYVIDPRTPLLQGDIGRAKASHLSLAAWLGKTFDSHVSGSEEGSLRVPVDFLDERIIEEMASELVRRQREYGDRADKIEQKLERYRRLRDMARGVETDQSERAPESRPPQFILAPYFAAGSRSDPWWRVNTRVWDSCLRLTDAKKVSAVVAVTAPAFLEEGMSQVPADLSGTAFYWLTGLDERRASRETLELVANAVGEASATRQWVNLYGGFFSICLGYRGLWGFSNGLGYSESRDWPELATTGAAPPRYYVRSLHRFFAPAVAQLIVDADEAFSCDCTICQARGGHIVDMGYHEFKQHFALSRAWEIALTARLSPAEISNHLMETSRRFDETVARLIPSTLIPDLRFLRTWAAVVGNMP